MTGALERTAYNNSLEPPIFVMYLCFFYTICNNIAFLKLDIDWLNICCRSCGNNNFGWRNACNLCNTAKPGSEDDDGGRIEINNLQFILQEIVP